ncbi:DUF3052 domain-containing protein [Demequina flava]|uniref:DUF3052 domain-containing protein n=1 Tax=Demequina flava TaxID=1095025 RepID=UPI0009E1B917|nr:DUF3052 domain-containing protein [Demequina flava]
MRVRSTVVETFVQELRGEFNEGSATAVATQEGTSTVDDGVIARFDLTKGLVLQEFGYDEDVDLALREAITEITGEELADEDYGHVTDGVLVWFREGEDDLTDLLMDVQSLLDDGGTVWLFTPKAGKTGHVPPRDVQESAAVAGLHGTTTFVVGQGWSCTRLVDKGWQK